MVKTGKWRRKEKVKEVIYDEKDRADYLGGFSKRKAQRKAKSIENRQRREQEERIKRRAILREEKKAVVEQYFARINATIDINSWGEEDKLEAENDDRANYGKGCGKQIYKLTYDGDEERELQDSTVVTVECEMMDMSSGTMGSCLAQDRQTEDKEEVKEGLRRNGESLHGKEKRKINHKWVKI